MKKTILYILFFITLFVPCFQVNAQNERGKVIGDYVTIRSKASSGASELNKVIFGTYVTIIGEEGSFYKVIYDGLNTGYMSKQYILKDSEYKLDDPEYCTLLKNVGFPESYCPYLSYIHKIHPTWTYTPLITNLDFYNQVVNGEEGQNYIQSTNDAYRVSNKLMEAGGYYTSNNTVNAYFLDPRNFILDKTMFMFENLGYVERPENKATVSSIFGSTSFLNTTTDNGISYIDYYIDAGKTYNVSPVHLAASTLQEGAANGEYGAVTGTYTGTYQNKPLLGYYNFFNIGAYADSNTNNPMLRGIAYAAGYVGGDGKSYGRPWDTRKKAIYGGTQFVSATYIGVGQNTVYLKKFQVNPSATSNLYTHQYMTNIFAPYNEGRIARSGYEKNSLLDLSFNFLIPVFNNMPTETNQPSLLSANNLLSSINLDGQPLPGFDADIKEYSLFYLDTKTSVSISAISNSADAVVTGVGTIDLPNEDNRVVVTVTAQNGDKREYIINIKRVKDTTTVEEVVQKLGVKNKDNYLYGINTGTAISTIVASVNKISPTATVKVVDSANNEKTGNLATGDKIIIKTLTSQEKTFDVVINGDVNGDSVVDIRDLLNLQKHLLGMINLSDSYLIAADVNYNSEANIQDLLRIQKYLLGMSEL